MKELSLKETFLKSYKMWLWLSEHPNKHKSEYLKFIKFKGIILNSCFFCEYSIIQAENNNIANFCKICPALSFWTVTNDNKNKNHKGFIPCTVYESPYKKWTITEDNQEKCKLAKQISDYCQREYLKIKYNKED